MDAAPGHYIVDTDGTVAFEPLSPTNTTIYVTYKSNGLALLRPIRDFGGKGGQIFADLVEPALKVIVDAGYPDNNPISAPDVYTPMRLFTPPKVAADGCQAAACRHRTGHRGGKADLKAPAHSQGRPGDASHPAPSRRPPAPGTPSAADSQCSALPLSHSLHGSVQSPFCVSGSGGPPVLRTSTTSPGTEKS